GSIDVGKDADLALFNGHPLNGYSRVEMTLVEGEVYFQRSEKLKAFAASAVPPATPVKEIKPIERRADASHRLLCSTVHPVSGAAVETADLSVERVTTALIVPRAGKDLGVDAARVIKADGLHVYPGMIDAGTVIGLTEVDSARETSDFAEGGDFQPDLRASTA